MGCAREFESQKLGMVWAMGSSSVERSLVKVRVKLWLYVKARDQGIRGRPPRAGQKHLSNK
jgi:hypothetical protein